MRNVIINDQEIKALKCLFKGNGLVRSKASLNNKMSAFEHKITWIYLKRLIEEKNIIQNNGGVELSGVLRCILDIKNNKEFILAEVDDGDDELLVSKKLIAKSNHDFIVSNKKADYYALEVGDQREIKEALFNCLFINKQISMIETCNRKMRLRHFKKLITVTESSSEKKKQQAYKKAGRKLGLGFDQVKKMLEALQCVNGVNCFQFDRYGQHEIINIIHLDKELYFFGIDKMYKTIRFIKNDKEEIAEYLLYPKWKRYLRKMKQIFKN